MYAVLFVSTGNWYKFLLRNPRHELDTDVVKMVIPGQVAVDVHAEVGAI